MSLLIFDAKHYLDTVHNAMSLLIFDAEKVPGVLLPISAIKPINDHCMILHNFHNIINMVAKVAGNQVFMWPTDLKLVAFY